METIKVQYVSSPPNLIFDERFQYVIHPRGRLLETLPIPIGTSNIGIAIVLEEKEPSAVQTAILGKTLLSLRKYYPEALIVGPISY